MRKKIVLVVEDDANDAFLLKRAFIKAGINVQLDFVDDGQKAIDYLERLAEAPAQRCPQLLILDLKLPRLDGFDVLAWIRSQAYLRRLPVTVLTSSGLRSDINRAFDLGASSYIVKPGHLDALQEISEELYKYWLQINESPDLGN